MAKVKFKRYNTKDEALNSEIEDGSFIVTKDGHTYIDYGADRIPTSGTPDNTMSNTSENTVQNKVIKEYVDNKYQNLKDYVDKNTYSTDEIVIGTFLGKPLYRKVITGYLNNAPFNHGIENAVFHKVNGIYLTTTGLTFPIPSTRPNYPEYQIGMWVSKTQVIFEKGNGIGNYYTEIVLEYTKTTDV